MNEEDFNQPLIPAFPRKRVGPRAAEAPVFRADYVPSKLITTSDGKMSTNFQYTQAQLDEINGVVKPAGALPKSTPIDFHEEGAYVVASKCLLEDCLIYSVILDGYRVAHWNEQLVASIKDFHRNGSLLMSFYKDRQDTFLVAKGEKIDGKYHFVLTEGAYLVEFEAGPYLILADGNSWTHTFLRPLSPTDKWQVGSKPIIPHLTPFDIESDRVIRVTPYTLTDEEQELWEAYQATRPTAAVKPILIPSTY